MEIRGRRNAGQEPCCFFLFTFLAFSLCAGQSYIQSSSSGDERYLREFAKAIFPLTWNFNGNPCDGSWEGVYCDSNGTYVTKLDLSSLRIGLTGVLTWNISAPSPPPAGGGLGGGLGGGIGSPPAKANVTLVSVTPISGLKRLKVLNMSRNSILGVIPRELSLLVNLEHLRLDHNLMSGDIPDSLGTLKNLTCIDLSSNNFTGTIPSGLRGFPCLDFADNPLLNTTGACVENAPKSCPQPPLPSNGTTTATSSSSNLGAIVGGAVGGAAAIALIILAFLLFRHHKEKKADELKEALLAQDLEQQILQRHFGSLTRFTLEDLSKATNNFNEDNLIGEGGFSRVYKGTVASGKAVAIKRLKADNQTDFASQFLDEVEIIARTSHRHLMKVDGFCVQGGECMLVMPYMANGSVASRTQDREGNPMDWPTRRKVAQGAAEGIAYMHTDCSPKLIHRDIKAANVLLDDNDEAVIADFGLAKSAEDLREEEEDVKNGEHVVEVDGQENGAVGKQSQRTGDEAGEEEGTKSKRKKGEKGPGTLKGTRGHIAPEYLLNGDLSEKTDVYAFGVFLLELVSGKRVEALCDLFEATDMMIYEWLSKLLRDKTYNTELLDSELSPSKTELEEIEKLLMAAVLCLHTDPIVRPDMTAVVSMLADTGGGPAGGERWKHWQEMVPTFDESDQPKLPSVFWEGHTTGIDLSAFEDSSNNITVNTISV